MAGVHFEFARASGQSLPEVAVAAAERIVSCTVFLLNGKPFYFGNHKAAASAAQNLKDIELASLRANPDPKVKLALAIIGTYRHFQKFEKKNSVYALYQLAYKLKKAGALQNWQPHPMRGPAFNAA